MATINQIRALLDSFDTQSLEQTFLIKDEVDDDISSLLQALPPDSRVLIQYCYAGNESLDATVCKSFEATLSLVRNAEMEVIRKLAKGKAVTTRSCSVLDMKYCLCTGMVFLKKVGRIKRYVMPMQLRELYSQLDKSNLKAVAKLNNIFEICSNAAIRLYGVIPTSTFFSMVEGYLRKVFEIDTKDNEFLRQAEDNFIKSCKVNGPDYVKYNSILWADLSKQEYDELLLSRKDKGVARLSFELFSSFAFVGFFENKDAMEALESSLKDAEEENYEALLILFGHILVIPGVTVDFCLKHLKCKDPDLLEKIKENLEVFDRSLRHWEDYGNLRE